MRAKLFNPPAVVSGRPRSRRRQEGACTGKRTGHGTRTGYRHGKRACPNGNCRIKVVLAGTLLGVWRFSTERQPAPWNYTPPACVPRQQRRTPTLLEAKATASVHACAWWGSLRTVPRPQKSKLPLVHHPAGARCVPAGSNPVNQTSSRGEIPPAQAQHDLPGAGCRVSAG